MQKTHQYSTNIIWTGNLGSGTLDYRSYSRDYTVSVDGKEEIEGSSDPKFRGDDSRINPEELFLASVSSCHMLWYLHLAAVSGITVLEYEDAASGEMAEDQDGSGRFTKITLAPNILIAQPDRLDDARKLHAAAGKKCFIANSINVKPSYAGQITAEG